MSLELQVWLTSREDGLRGIEVSSQSGNRGRDAGRSENAQGYYALETLENFSTSGTGGSSVQGGIGVTLDFVNSSSTVFDFYGVTQNGGANGDGTIFQEGSGTSIPGISFNGSNGASPASGLLQIGGVPGYLYGSFLGTTSVGGATNQGTLYSYTVNANADTQQLTTLVNFNSSSGYSPVGPLSTDLSGNVYGLLDGDGNGTIYELPAANLTSGVTSKLVNIGSLNGSTQSGTFAFDAAGDLFGTKELGGNGSGSLYEYSPQANSLSTLVTFSSSTGQYPVGGLVTDGNGNFFGVTRIGGTANDGTIFEYSQTTHAVTTLASFNGSNGSSPQSLMMDPYGNLFGTTASGGSGGDGTVFEVFAGSTFITDLASFNGSNGSHVSPTLSTDGFGDILGATKSGGTGGGGTLFELASQPLTGIVNQSGGTYYVSDGFVRTGPLNEFAYVGNSFAVDGTLALSSGAQTSSGGAIIIGVSGSGTLTATGTGTVVGGRTGAIFVGAYNSYPGAPTGNGFPGSGVMNISSGASAQPGDLIIGECGGQGSVTLTGTGSSIITGLTGTIDYGSQFTTSGVSGGLIVGLDETNTYVGRGTLSVLAGATVTTGVFGVGVSAGNGTASIDGSGTTITCNTLDIGDSGDATYVNIYNSQFSPIYFIASHGTASFTNGARAVCFGNASIGTNAGTGTLTLDGASTIATIGGGLVIGQGVQYASGAEAQTTLFYGSGTLSITNTAQVRAEANVSIGQDGGTGLISISGTNSALLGSGGILTIGSSSNGYASTGSLNVSSGGVLGGFSQIQLGIGISNTGNLNLTFSPSGNFTCTSLIIGPGGRLNQSGGTLNCSGLYMSGGSATLAEVVLSVGAAGVSLQGPATIALQPDANSPGTLVLASDLSANLATGEAVISSGTVSGGQISGEVELGGTRNFDVTPGTAAVQLLISAAITEGTLIKTGDGVMQCASSFSNFSGGLVVTGGTLQITATAPFSGNIELLADNGASFGTLSVSTDLELGVGSNKITLAGGTLLATGSFATLRVITLGDSVGNGNGTLSVTAGNTLTVNSTISGLAGLIKQGAGTLTLDGNLSYQGATQVMAGTLLLGAGVQLPGQSVVGVAPGATLNLGGQSRSFSALQDITYGGGSGTISIGPATMTVGVLPSSTIFSGNINGSTGGAVVMSGTGSLTLAGPLTGFTGGVSVTQGTLFLTNPSNTFTGGVTANGGALQVINDGAMGNASNNITLSSGGTLEVTATFSTARNVNVSTSGGTIAVGIGSTLTSSGTIGGSAPLTISGTTLIPGMTLGSGTLSLTSAQPFSGPLTIDGDAAATGGIAGITLLLSGSGSLDSVSSITLKGAGTLEAEDGTGLTSGRFSRTTALYLDGGMLEIAGRSSGLSDESLGGLSTSAYTSSTIDLLDGSGGGIDLSFASYARGAGATLYFDMSGSDQIKFTGITADQSLAGAWLTEMNPATGVPFTGHAYYDINNGVEFIPGTGPAGIGDTSSTGTSLPEPGISTLTLAATIGALTRRSRRTLR